MEPDAILLILLSWASHLSGYPMPAHPPEVRYENHGFFVEQVCGGNDCNVVGWYNDADIVYIDRKYLGLESGFATSLMVHEFTHYLQHKSGNFRSRSCEDSVQREREAYYVQSRYVVEALARIDRVRLGPMACNYGNAGLRHD